MTARLVATVLARAEAWLLEPAPPPAEGPGVDPVQHPVIAVVGLARRCGTTTVVRALAAELAARTEETAVVAGPVGGAGLSLGTPAARRLARTLQPPARPCGRLCLLATAEWRLAADAVRGLAAIVLDVGHGSPAGAAASLADEVVLVASPEVEPALAAVVAASLARSGPEPVLVVNRTRPDGPWAGRPTIELPDSPAAARISLAGGRAPGALGTAIAEVADRCRRRQS